MILFGMKNYIWIILTFILYQPVSASDWYGEWECVDLLLNSIIFIEEADSNRVNFSIVLDNEPWLKADTGIIQDSDSLIICLGNDTLSMVKDSNKLEVKSINNGINCDICGSYYQTQHFEDFWSDYINNIEDPFELSKNILFPIKVLETCKESYELNYTEYFKYYGNWFGREKEFFKALDPDSIPEFSTVQIVDYYNFDLSGELSLLMQYYRIVEKKQIGRSLLFVFSRVKGKYYLTHVAIFISEEGF